MGNLQKPLHQSTQLQRLSIPLRSINSIKRKAVIEEAISWIDTPYHHQGREKNIGCDCIGLIIGIARHFDFDKIVSFNDYKSYSKNPDGKQMTFVMKKYLKRILRNNLLPGDILHFSFIQFPQHVAMFMPNGFIIHAHEPDNKVIYHSLDDWWFSRIVGCYRYRGLI